MTCNGRPYERGSNPHPLECQHTRRRAHLLSIEFRMSSVEHHIGEPVHIGLPFADGFCDRLCLLAGSNQLAKAIGGGRLPRDLFRQLPAEWKRHRGGPTEKWDRHGLEPTRNSNWHCRPRARKNRPGLLLDLVQDGTSGRRQRSLLNVLSRRYFLYE